MSDVVNADAEVAEIEKRDAEPIPLSLSHSEFTRRASQAEIDRHTLLAKLRARTSQAEAQAPTTAAPHEQLVKLHDELCARSREEYSRGHTNAGQRFSDQAVGVSKAIAATTAASVLTEEGNYCSVCGRPRRDWPENFNGMCISYEHVEEDKPCPKQAVVAPAPAPTQTAKDALIDALDKTGIPAAVERAREKAAPAPTIPTREQELTTALRKAVITIERSGFKNGKFWDMWHCAICCSRWIDKAEVHDPECILHIAKGGTP